MSQIIPTRDTTSGNSFIAEFPSRASDTGIPRFLVVPDDVGSITSEDGKAQIDDNAFLICENETWSGTVGKYKEDDKSDPWVEVYLRYETSQTRSGRWGKSPMVTPKTTKHIFLSATPMTGVRQRGHHKDSKFGQTGLEDYSVVLVPYGDLELRCCSPGIEPEGKGFRCIAPQPEKGSRDSISKEDRRHQHTLWLKCTRETEEGSVGLTHVKLPGNGRARYYNSPEADELGVNKFYEDGKGPGEMGYESDGQTCGGGTILAEACKSQGRSDTQTGRRRTRCLTRPAMMSELKLLEGGI